MVGSRGSGGLRMMVIKGVVVVKGVVAVQGWWKSRG